MRHGDAAGTVGRHDRRDVSPDDRHLSVLHDEIELQLMATERQQINDLFRSGKLKDEARRRIERELDLRQAHLINQQAEEVWIEARTHLGTRRFRKDTGVRQGGNIAVVSVTGISRSCVEKTPR
jgi:hypothetical protein